MDFSADSGTLSTCNTVEGQAGEQELSLCSTHCKAGSGGTILLQLLEFKTHLLEAVEELHIRRDTETRFEDQLSKLVLEKQELDWEKESLQHQIETVANQQKESMTNVKKQFQAKIRSVEEEKWKHQLSAELKDKEINNLKEELKSLQLLKYNLEKKSSELEQKLALQSRSKDSHLNQLGEVEKRFSALSRQCAMVKKAHEKLQQNVNEAMNINRKLSSENEKLEATTVSLKKELEEVSKQLIKAKMTSVTHDKTHISTGKQQFIQQLHQKLNMETEINKKLWEENKAVRTEKQEVMRSLHHAQHLLLSQTQTVSRVELELQTQRDQYQALKQEHEMMRVKSKAVEDKVVQLMESYTASKKNWDKERAVFLGRIKNEQKDLQAVKETCNALHQKHTELSLLAKAQPQRIVTLEMRDRSQILSVSTQVFPTLEEEVRAEKSLNEPIPSSELYICDRQHMVSSLTKNPDCLEDKGTVAKLVATGATGGQEALNQDHHAQYQQSVKHLNLLMCPLNTNNLVSLSSHSGTGTNILNEFICNSKTSGCDPDAVSDLINTSSAVSDNNLQIDKGSSVSGTTAVSTPDHRSVYRYVDLVRKGKNETGNVGRNEKNIAEEDDRKQENSNRNEEDRNTEQQCIIEEVPREEVKGGQGTGEKRGTLMTQTTDRADRHKDNKGSAEDAGDTRNPETETQDRAEGEWTDGVEERGKTAAHTSETPETQIPDQTAADTTIEKSNTQQVVDFMYTEPLLAVSEASDCSQSISLKVMDADFSHANKGWGILREEQLLPTLNPVDSQSVNCGPNPIIQEVQNLCCNEVLTQGAESLSQLPNHIDEVSEKTTTEETPCDMSAADFTTELSEPLNQSRICCTQADAALLFTQTDDTASIQQVEKNTATTVPSDPSDTKSKMKQCGEMCDTNVTKEGFLLRTLVESQSLPSSQKISEQENGQPESLITDDDDDDDGDCNAYRKSEGQSNVGTQEKSNCQTVQEPMETSNLKDTFVDITMTSVELESEVESGHCQEHRKKDKIEATRDATTPKSETDLNLHKNDESAETRCSKGYELPPAKEMLLDNTDESFLHSSKTYRSSFDWGSAQKKTAMSRSQSDILILHQVVEGTEPNTIWSGGKLRHPSSTIPMFLESKHNKVPLVITRASELLNASSVSGTAASSKRHQQGEWKAIGETGRDTTAADMESRASLSISSFPSSASSSTVSRLSWQTTPECSKGPTSAIGFILESDWEASNSLEREDQQSSFRAQISKIEQFLNKERLGLPKRRRTDN